jgi:tetratricopeptide (TPR) repeat protein
VSILATDISTTALAAAERAAYRARSVRGITPALRERYFTVDRDYLVVAGQLRSIVRFKHHNLVHAAGPGTAATFDLVTCRNTLIYFDPPTVDNVIGSLQRSVSRGGTLILGAADRISASPPAAGAIPALAPGRPRSTPDASPKHKRMPAPQQPKAGPSDPGVATVEAGLVAAVAAADAGDLDTAVELAGAVLASEPLNAQAHFIRGLALLSNGDPRAAAESLRRALYVRPDFALAAFNLGRALELTGDRAAASNSYTRALRNCDGPRAEVATDDEISPGDLAAACRLRIRALANPTVPQTGRAGPAR